MVRHAKSPPRVGSRLGDTVTEVAAKLEVFFRNRNQQVLKRSGSLWKPDYWDTFMRDEDQERKAIRYIENNPVKANLCRAATEWKFSSAEFRDSYRRLVVPSTTERRAPALRVPPPTE